MLWVWFIHIFLLTSCLQGIWFKRFWQNKQKNCQLNNVGAIYLETAVKLAGSEAASKFYPTDGDGACKLISLDRKQLFLVMEEGQIVDHGNIKERVANLKKIMNISINGLPIQSNKYVKYIFCILVSVFAMWAFFQLLLRTFILGIFNWKTGGSPGRCNSGSRLKELWIWHCALFDRDYIALPMISNNTVLPNHKCWLYLTSLAKSEPMQPMCIVDNFHIFYVPLFCPKVMIF